MSGERDPVIMEATVAGVRQGNRLADAEPEAEESVGWLKLEGRLTDAIVRGLSAPASGSRITYDGGPEKVRGFGIRVTAAGAKSFILNYTVGGRERRMTIGAYPTWRVSTARAEAERLRREIDRGVDPLGEKIAEREAPTVAELCDRYLAEHAVKILNSHGVTAFLDALASLPIVSAMKRVDDQGKLTAWAVAALPAFEAP